MNQLDNYLPSLDAGTIAALHNMASQFTSFTKSFASEMMVVNFSRDEVINWMTTGHSTYLQTDCAASVLPSVYYANKEGLAAMTPEMAASLGSGLMPTFGDEPTLSPLISPLRAVIYWSWLGQRLFWLANHDGLSTCSQSGPIDHRGFIASSDILSAMAPDWTGLYRPLPKDFPGVSVGSFPATSIAGSLSQSPQSLQGQPPSTSTQTTQTPASTVGISSPLLIVVGLVILFLVIKS